MVSVLVNPPDIRLNVAVVEADTALMTPYEEEQSEPVRTGWLAGLEAAHPPGRQRAVVRIQTEQELEALRQKVSLLAMQKDYWHERSDEHASALRAAQAEVARLNEVLDVLPTTSSSPSSDRGSRPTAAPVRRSAVFSAVSRPRPVGPGSRFGQG